MAKNLVIVESPAKAKTIENYLGKDFVVKSSFGQIRDLPKSNYIDINNNFKPSYIISDGKKKVVRELKAAVKKSKIVWLATDEDREGEAISWHLKEALKLKEENTRRIAFNEITKNAILNAVANPRDINYDLVNAQQARRILDRLVGFGLSPVLWKKVKGGLSAGRVQSPTVRLIVEREEEIKKFTSKSSFKVSANFEINGNKFKADLNKSFISENDAYQFLESCISANYKVISANKKPATKTPTAPFTTSTLQQDASRKLGFNVSRTMSVAQNLYEAGKITYMRTDSVNLSDFALSAAKNEISKAYGSNYVKTRKYQNKQKSAQEAHEAIRPTDFSIHSIGNATPEASLYKLIWLRAIASQMSDAQIERTKVNIDISTNENLFIASGEVIKFDGFLKVYIEGKDDDNKQEIGMLPALKVGDKPNNELISAKQSFSRPPARYTEATLVRKLEELGIGRPSTYAPTIKTIQDRGYVERNKGEAKTREAINLTLKLNDIKKQSISEKYGADKGKLVPTDIGNIVNGFLVNNFKNIIDYNFTANVEKELDTVANGNLKWSKMLDSFYHPFTKTIENAGGVERETGERVLGKDSNGEKVIVRLAKYGPVIQIGETSEDKSKKPRFAGLLASQHIDTITLEEALELFKLPRTVGSFEGEEVVAAIGRFGPYLRYKSKFTSLKKADGDDPLTIGIDRAIELIKISIQAEKDRLILNFDGEPLVQVLNGRYGAFIQVSPKKGRKINVKIPKGTEPKTLTRDKCLELMENQPKGKKTYKTKKK